MYEICSKVIIKLISFWCLYCQEKLKEYRTFSKISCSLVFLFLFQLKYAQYALFSYHVSLP